MKHWMTEVNIVVDDNYIIIVHLKWIWKQFEQSNPKYVYPRYTGGSNKVDCGLLPIEIPETIWISDPTYGTKVALSNIFFTAEI